MTGDDKGWDTPTFLVGSTPFIRGKLLVMGSMAY